MELERVKSAISDTRCEKIIRRIKNRAKEISKSDKSALIDDGINFFSRLFSGFARRYSTYPRIKGSKIPISFGSASHKSAAGIKNIIKSRQRERSVLKEIKKITLK